MSPSLLVSSSSRKTFATNFAVKIFGHADDEYRAGFATRETAKNFYAASVFFEVLLQFDDPLPDEIEGMRKYAKYSAVQITKAIKQGIPVVHPDSEANDDSGGGLGEDATNRQDFDPFAAMGDFPSIPSSVGPANAPYGMHPSPSSFPAAPDGRQPPSPMDAMDFSGSAWGNSFGPLSSSPGEGPSARSTSLPPGYDFPPSSGQPGMPASSPSGGGVSLDSVEQMLALFPTVPMTSSSASVSPPTGGSWSNWPNPPSASSGHSASPTSFSSGQAQPRSGPAPLIPKATQGPQPTPQSPPAPASAPATSSSNKGPTGDFTPSAENIAKAQKCARFAVSALQFEDLPYAVDNLKQALALLTGK